MLTKRERFTVATVVAVLVAFIFALACGVAGLAFWKVTGFFVVVIAAPIAAATMLTARTFRQED